MGFKTLDELRAYRAARALKLEVYRLVKSRPSAARDAHYRNQLFNAAASVEMNIAEGFRRYNAGEFAHYLRISRSSLEETERWLQDGIDREYFTKADCALAFQLADETGRLTMGLWHSLQPLVARNRKARTSTHRRKARSSPDADDDED